MPRRKTKLETDILRLEKELIETKFELDKLKSSRVYKTIGAVRNIKKNPKAILSVPTALMKREKVSKTPVSKLLYNPLTNGMPLFKYTNINIGLILDKKSKFRDMFMQTCNANDIEHENIQELSSYRALQAVIVDLEGYNSREGSSDLIKTAIDNESKLIVIKYKNDVLPERLKQYEPTVIECGIDESADVQPFSNIYSIVQRQCPRLLDDINDVHRVESEDDISLIRHRKLSILSKDFLSSISYDGACNVLDKIAAYNPVLVEGDRPLWISNEVMTFDSESKYQSILCNLNEPYSVDMYGVECGRAIIINSNGLEVSSSILYTGGIVDEKLNETPKVSVIISAQRPDLLKDTLGYLDKQTLKPHEIILMLHGVDKSKIKNIQEYSNGISIPVYIDTVSSRVLFGDVLNKAVDKASGEYITKVDDDDYYGENHILDLYAAHLSSRADFVGKTNNWTYLKASDELLNYRPKDSCRYVRRLPGATMFARTSVFKENKFGKVKRMIDSELYRRAELRGATIYSTHKYNFVRVRHGSHTYVSDDNFFKEQSDENTINGADKSIWSI